MLLASPSGTAPPSQQLADSAKAPAAADGALGGGGWWRWLDVFRRGFGRRLSIDDGSAKRPALALHVIEEQSHSAGRHRSNSRPPPNEPARSPRGEPPDEELQCVEISQRSPHAL